MNRAFFFFTGPITGSNIHLGRLFATLPAFTANDVSLTPIVPPPPRTPPNLGGVGGRNPQTLHAAANWQLVQKCYFPKSRIAAPVGFLPGRGEEVVVAGEGEGGRGGSPLQKNSTESVLFIKPQFVFGAALVHHKW